jgi:predicted metal-binding membrane protein
MAALAGSLRSDRLLILAAIAVITALAWLDLVAMTGAMRPAMTGMSAESMVGILPLFIMWAVMMVGMMLPSAAPMIVLFATVNRQKRKLGTPYVPTAIFVLGYVAAWTAFSLCAAVLQSELHALALLSPMMMSTSGILGGALFLVAGVYQWTPWKHACLRFCRSPLDFLLNHWREGSVGALRMGLEHGFFCVGCCWFLMGLLFAVGVMNLLWVAAIAVFVLAEKMLPGGLRIAHASGVLMIAAGLFLLQRGVAG